MVAASCPKGSIVSWGGWGGGSDVRSAMSTWEMALLQGYRLCHIILVVQTMVEVVNMLPPPHMLPQKAPKLVAPLRCAITGKPARYRDPASGYGYADLEAYKELKLRMQSERRGLTGKRTKRPSSKGLGTSPRMHQQDIESDAAQLATGAAQDHAAVPSDTQAADATDQLPKQAQSAAGDKAADPSRTAVASDTAHAAAAAPVTAVSFQPPAAVASPAAGPSQSQAALAAVPPGVAGTIADAAEAVRFASTAQQGSQQAKQLSPATANAAAAGPGSNVSSETADDVIMHTAAACMPPLPAVSKPAADSSGNVTGAKAVQLQKHCITSKVLHCLTALPAALLFCCICLPWLEAEQLNSSQASSSQCTVAVAVRSLGCIVQD